MTPTNHETHCAFKAMGSYWSITVGGKSSENEVWSDERPCDETADLKEQMAIYIDRMDEVIASGG